MTLRNWAIAIVAFGAVSASTVVAQAAPAVGFGTAAPVADRGNAVEKATFYRQRGCWRYGRYICGYARGYGYGNGYYTYGYAPSLGLFFGGGRGYRGYGGGHHAFHGGGGHHHR